MEKLRKFELIKRSLGLRHKLKVHESLKHPETHEELAHMLLAKWDHEDELRAIEEILAEARQKNVLAKRSKIEQEATGDSAADQAEDRAAAKVTSKKKAKK